tara:strand:+ start:123 stop:506 length:384 start_codon:yes stop_codon:yes gene_type:complete
MNTQTETKQEIKFNRLTNLIYNNTGIDLTDYLDALELDDFNLISVDDLWSELDDKGAFDVDIIYYNRAMNYLLENDFSLSESIELAVDMGYELKNINSETLASLHASQKIRNDFWNISTQIDEILSE